MIIYKITLTIKGEKFSPSEFLKKNDTNFFIFDKNEPDEIIWDTKSDKYDFGSISIIQNGIYCLKNEFDSYEKWYRDFISKNKNILNNLGMEQIIYNIDIFYSDFCSFELSGTENYNDYINYNLAIPINVYKISEKEIIKILIQNGVDLQLLSNYEW